MEKEPKLPTPTEVKAEDKEMDAEMEKQHEVSKHLSEKIKKMNDEELLKTWYDKFNEAHAKGELQPYNEVDGFPAEDYGQYVYMEIGRRNIWEKK